MQELRRCEGCGVCDDREGCGLIACKGAGVRGASTAENAGAEGRAGSLSLVRDNFVQHCTRNANMRARGAHHVALVRDNIIQRHT